LSPYTFTSRIIKRDHLIFNYGNYLLMKNDCHQNYRKYNFGNLCHTVLKIMFDEKWGKQFLFFWIVAPPKWPLYNVEICFKHLPISIRRNSSFLLQKKKGNTFNLSLQLYVIRILFSHSIWITLILRIAVVRFFHVSFEVCNRYFRNKKVFENIWSSWVLKSNIVH